MRVELKDGQWVDVRERITHAEDKEIKRAQRRANENIDETWNDLTVALRIMLRAGHVLDPDGAPISLPATMDDEIERLPKDICDELMPIVLSFHRKATVPNPPTPPSSPS